METRTWFMQNRRDYLPYRRISQKLIILRLAIVGALIILPLFVLVKPTQSMDAPTSAPTITSIHVNRNLVTTGDWLVYADYDIPYTVTANMTPADSSFIFRLIATDGTTELGAIAPYAYSSFNLGYNEGNVFFYFTGAGLVWGTEYIIRISENPAFFASPTYWDFPVPTTAYTSSTSQLNNQAEVAANVLVEAKRLQSTYGLPTTEPSPSGLVLSSPYGETYFRGACYGLQAMAPTLFFVQLIQLDTTSTNWTTTQADIWESQFSTTWVAAGGNATASQFGLTPTTVAGMFIVFPVTVGIMILSSFKFKRIEPGLVSNSVLLILAFLMGWIPAAVFASLYQLMGIYTGYVWFYARS